MFTFLVVVIAIIALLLTGVVLLQSGKGGGLAGIASGGATQQVLGARQAPDVLEKATWSLATVFIVLCLLTSFTIDRGGEQESVIQQRTQEGQTEQPASPVLPPAQGQQAPDAGAGQGQQQPAPQPEGQ